MALIINNNQFPIQTVAPTLALGEIMVSADRRTAKDAETKLTDAERIRRVVLPAGHWQEISATLAGEKSQGLTDVLREALRSIANDRLKDALAETPMLPAVEAAHYTVAALLAWSEETASSRGSITFTRDQAEEWFKQSRTQQNLVAKWMEAGKTADQMRVLSDFALKRFCALAAKNHGIKDAADADKLLALVAPEDAGTGIGSDIVGRIAHISKALTAKAEETNISMDDL